MAVPLLLGGLAKNSQDPQEAENISTALSESHDGSILDNIMSSVQDDATSKDGSKIVDHILGNKQVVASQAIASKVNLDSGQVIQILSLIAPVVMGSLGKKQKHENLGSSGLTTLLQNFLGGSSGKKSKNSGFIENLLDQNNDGSIIDDVAKIGINALGNLFKKS